MRRATFENRTAPAPFPEGPCDQVPGFFPPGEPGTDPLATIQAEARALARRLDHATALFGFAAILFALLWFLSASVGAELPR